MVHAGGRGPWRRPPGDVDKHHIPFHLWAFLNSAWTCHWMRTVAAALDVNIPSRAQAQSQPRSVQSLHVGKDRKRPCFSNTVPVLRLVAGKPPRIPPGLFGKAQVTCMKYYLKGQKLSKRGSKPCSHYRVQPAPLPVPRAQLVVSPESQRKQRASHGQGQGC